MAMGEHLVSNLRTRWSRNRPGVTAAFLSLAVHRSTYTVLHALTVAGLFGEDTGPLDAVAVTLTRADAGALMLGVRQCRPGQLYPGDGV
jgi:hypothetical protein